MKLEVKTSNPAHRHFRLPHPDYWLAAGLCIALIALVALNVANIKAPVDRDEGAFLVIAQSILHGSVPYRDIFDQKPPGTYYLLAGILFMTRGMNPLSQLFVARVAVLLANLLTAAGLVVLGRRWHRPWVGVIAAGYFLFVLPLYSGDQVFTEPFAVLCEVGAVVVAARARSIRGAACAGLLLALGMLFKQTALLSVPGVLLLIIAGVRRQEGGWSRATVARILHHTGVLAAGLIAPWLVLGAVFWRAGALGDLINQTVIINLVHYPPDPAEVRTATLLSALAEAPLVWVMPLVVIATDVWRRVSGRPARFPLGIIGLTAVVTALLHLTPFVSHVYFHYWLEVLPWAALLTGLGIVQICSSLQASQDHATGHYHRILRGARLAVVVSLCAITSLTAMFLSLRLPENQIALAQQLHTSALISRDMAHGDRVFVAPAEPEYYYLANLAPPTRYVYLLPVDASSQVLTELSHDIQMKRFAVVVWQAHKDKLDQQPDVAPLHALLAQSYHLVTTDPDTEVEIYLRNE